VSFDWITFDCYGTLVDWETGIGDAFAGAARAAGIEIDRDAALDAYMRLEPIVEAGTFRPYRDVLCETAIRVAERLGWELDREQASFLPRSVAGWGVFPDTRPALARLRATGCRLGILSNVDADLLAGTLQVLDTPFDLLVTAQQVRSYKPGHAHFVQARRTVGDSRWLHAAQSWFHDVVPARELSIPVAWINRRAESPHGALRPDHEFRDLAGLADWIEAGQT